MLGGPGEQNIPSYVSDACWFTTHLPVVLAPSTKSVNPLTNQYIANCGSPLLPFRRAWQQEAMHAA